MASSMNARSRPYSPKTSPVSTSIISSPGSASGACASVAPDGPTTDLFGPVAAPAAPSPSRVSARASTTRATFGRNGFGSSASAGLTASLVSNLMRRSSGSILFQVTWKASITPSGRLIYRLRASEARTAANGLRSSQTGAMPNGGPLAPLGMMDPGQSLAGWPTPTTSEGTGPQRSPEKQGGDSLRTIASMSGWATPAATDRPRSDETMAKCAAFRKANANQNSVPLYLGDQARLSAWSTPQAADAEWARVASATYTSLTAQALLTGSSAETADGVRLNPALARWLMRIPPVWDACAVTAMPSTSRRSRT